MFIDTAVVGVVDMTWGAGADGGVLGGDCAYFMFALEKKRERGVANKISKNKNRLEQIK